MVWLRIGRQMPFLTQFLTGLGTDTGRDLDPPVTTQVVVNLTYWTIWEVNPGLPCASPTPDQLSWGTSMPNSALVPQNAWWFYYSAPLQRFTSAETQQRQFCYSWNIHSDSNLLNGPAPTAEDIQCIPPPWNNIHTVTRQNRRRTAACFCGLKQSSVVRAA